METGVESLTRDADTGQTFARRLSTTPPRRKQLCSTNRSMGTITGSRYAYCVSSTVFSLNHFASDFIT